MKKISNCFYNRSFFAFFVLFGCVAGLRNASFAQCSTTTAPSYSNSCTSDYYTSVTAAGTGVTSTIAVSGSSCSGTYFDYYATQGIVVGGATTVNMSVARYATYAAYLSVYIDWNNDGIYQSTELAGSVIYMPVSLLSTVYSFTVPSSGVVTGTNLRMRMMLSEVSGGAPCSANWGETCDFYFNVNCPPTPFITVTPTADSMCSGGSGSVLTASGAGAGAIYTWSPASGLSTATGASVTAAPGATTIYTVTATTVSGCKDSTAVTLTVNPLPAAITNAAAICAGSIIALSDADAGGTWTGNNAGIAGVDAATGIVSGVSAGNIAVTYTLGSGCAITTTVTVNTSPSPISGVSSVCSGQTTMLSNSVGGGAWSSDNTPVATISGIGIVSGVTAGSANISYTIGSCAVGLVVSVNTILPITGGSNVCIGSTLALSDPTPGGVWSSGNASAGTVSPTGVVTGLGSGSAAIIYTIGACFVSNLVAVGAQVAAITASDTMVCSGSTITLHDATPAGTWNSDNMTVATVSGAGIVTGGSPGGSTISYSAGGCTANIHITVNLTNAGVIVGKDSICTGPAHQIALSDSVSGGTWSSVTLSRATVDPVTGIVTGVSTGVDTIKYTITNVCGTYTVKHVLHIRTAAQCATAVETLAEGVAAGLQVFPNPNTSTFSMSLASGEDENVHVVITNIVGRKVQEFVTTTNKATTIKLEPIAGIYLLSATTAHGRYVAKVVVD